MIVYHLVGEMFLGAWAAYTNQIMQHPDVANTTPVMDQLPEITRLIFAHVPPSEVYDHAGLSSFFFNNSLSVSVLLEDCLPYRMMPPHSPQAQWEFDDGWNARADSLELYRFDLITIADRKSGHMGGGFGKPM